VNKIAITLFLFGILLGILLGIGLVTTSKFDPLYHCYQVNTIAPQAIVWNQYKGSNSDFPPFCSVKVVFDGQPKVLTAEQYLEFIKEAK
jgi:hypothetical protein